MPVHFGNSDGSLNETDGWLEPVAPIVDLPNEPIKVAAPGSMGWLERLRTTEAELQRLSTGYPFTWHGDA
jgi:hypothetical protein